MEKIEEYRETFKAAEKYCLSRICHRKIYEKIFAMAKAEDTVPCRVYERINVPNVGKIICEYTFTDKCSIKGNMGLKIILKDEHENLILMPQSIYIGLSDNSICRRNESYAIVIYKHALDRFAERHHWDKGMSTLENHIINTMRKISYKKDMITNEILCPFDGGVFLGETKGDYNIHLKTFVMDRQLYTNQTCDSIKAKKFKKDMERETLSIFK